MAQPDLLARQPSPLRARFGALGLSWFAYASYYLGRKGFGVIKSRLTSELGLAPEALALIDTVYLLAYACGQLPSGLAVDRFGARRVVAAGLLLSAAACAAFGWAGGAIGFCVWFAVNGLAQATGWPGPAKAGGPWAAVL